MTDLEKNERKKEINLFWPPDGTLVTYLHLMYLQGTARVETVYVKLIQKVSG